MVEGGRTPWPVFDEPLFGFDDGDTWLDRVREAELPASLGCIGPYSIVEEIARGAQGVVYRARRAGAHGDVALKRIHGGRHANPAAARRFEREIEAVAMLDHPAIVSVRAVDVVDNSPVLAMEWVDGEPITKWAARQRGADGVGRILRVFGEVCDAVGYAHQRGVIHRDLKPGNIFVDRCERPRVLDFGLARVRSLDWTATVTSPDLFVGTVGYAAPEQASCRQPAPDVRADAYSLGVVLYECLTGRLPFPIDDGPLEWLRLAARGDLPRPMREARPLPRDLSSVLAMCLACKPEDRYQSVAELAADLARLTSGEPVAARPLTFWRTLRVLGRRHRPAMIAVAVGAAAVTLGGAAATVSAMRADQERRAAVEARDRELAARRAAEAVSEFIQRLLAVSGPEQAHGAVTVRVLLDEGRRRLDEDLANQPEIANDVRTALAHACHARGMDAEAAAEYARVLEFERARRPQDPRRLASALVSLASVVRNVAGPAGAAPYAEEGLRLARSLGEADPLLPEALRRYASTQPSPAAAETLREAIALTERNRSASPAQIIPLLNDLGYAAAAAGDLPGAEAVFRRALDAELASRGPASATAATLWQNLCDVRHRRGDLQGSYEAIAEAVRVARLAHAEPHPQLATLLLNQARVLNMLERNDEARSAAEEALETATTCAGPGHPITASALITLGGVLAAASEQARAEELLRDGIARVRTALGDHDHEAAVAAHRLSMLLQQQGRDTEAIDLLREGLALHERSPDPNRLVLSGMRRDLADLLLKRGRAEEAHREATAALQTVQSIPGVGANFIARARCTLAEVLLARGDRSAAAAMFRQVLQPGSEASAEVFTRAQSGLASSGADDAAPMSPDAP